MNGTVKRSTELDLVSAYIRGYVEGTIVASAAKELQCSPAELTERMGRAWVSTVRTRGKAPLSPLRKTGPATRKAMEPVGVASNTRGQMSKAPVKKRTMSAAGRKAISIAQKKRWAAQKRPALGKAS